MDTDPEVEPKSLHDNQDKGFQGSNIRGAGFILEPEEARILIAQDPRNKDCLFPFLIGEDLNSQPDQSPTRWIINFFDLPREKAESYPGLFKIARERVLPERQKIREPVSRRKNVTYFWRYDSIGRSLYRNIAGLKRVLARSKVSELHAICFVPTGVVYGDALVVFAFDDDYHFALPQSNVHEAWVRRNASTMRTDIRYTPTDCFETFPFPQGLPPVHHEKAARIGGDYEECRRQIMMKRNLGLTKTYKLFHDQGCVETDIVRLREFHTEIDPAVLACYGWEDLAPEHGFFQNERGQTRYTVSSVARREILRRLLDLNLSIAEEERQSTLHAAS